MRTTRGWVLGMLAAMAVGGAGSAGAAAATDAAAKGRAAAARGAGTTATPSHVADSVALVRLLDEFLAGAGRNDAEIHDRFWAEDLVYTGSGGRRVGKAEILRDVRSAPPPGPADPVTVYSAEEVRVRSYGAMAVVAFRLVATTGTAAGPAVARFLNTGTFAKRAGRWQAVAWQATRLPLPADSARAGAAAAAAAFQRALGAADTAAVAAGADPDFTWTEPGGARLSRAAFLAGLGSAFRFAPPGREGLEVQLVGEVALVRGRLAYGARRSGVAPPAARDLREVECTLTLAQAGGAWRAVALQASGR